MKTKSPLPWFGSDASVANQLGAMLDGCRHVTIPFAGGMSILPHLKAKGIVANDLHSDAYNFYHVAKSKNGDGMMFRELCRQTLSHPKELDLAKSILDEIPAFGLISCDDVQRAWAFWAQCWIVRKGKGGTKHQGGKPSVRRTANGGNNATRIKSAAADLEAWAEEFRRCEFTCEDFRECLKSVKDGPKQGVYCDAPWFGAGDGYLHSFDYYDHADLELYVRDLQGSPVVIRYGDHPTVRELYESDAYTITEATSRTQANKKLGELWITKNLEVPQ